MSEQVRTRKEQLAAELEALESLDKIEERREKSLATNVKRVHEKYDDLRGAALQEIDPKVTGGLAATDAAQRAYLDRVAARAAAEEAALEPVKEEDIEEVE